MITRYHLLCPGCNSSIRLRIGIGLEEIQPFFIVCPKCKAIIKGRLIIVGLGEANLKMDEAVLITDNLENPDYSITLHPDLPAISQASEMWEEGGSPFIYQSMIIGTEEMGKFQKRYNNVRNIIENEKIKILRFITYYKTKNWELFNSEGKGLLHDNWKDCINELDAIDSLVRVLEILFLLICYDNKYPKLKIEFSKLYGLFLKSNEIALKSFVNEFNSTIELDNMESDLFCSLEYIFNKLPVFAPAMIIQHYPKNKLANLQKFRIMHDEFDSLKTHYLDSFETCHSLLIIMIGMQNLIYRQNHNVFQNSIIKDTPKSIKNYQKLTSNDKAKFLPELKLLGTEWNWYFNRKMRNAIGHRKIRHNLETGYLILDNKEETSYIEFLCETHRLSTMIIFMLNVLRWWKIASVNISKK